MSKLKEHHEIIIVLIVSGIILLLYDMRYVAEFIYGDGRHYYRYLPELFIEHQLGDYNKYPVGTAYCILPFFLIVHIYTTIFNPEMADGWSCYYQYAVAISAIVAFIVGTFYLYKMLVILYNKTVGVWTCLLLIAGTMISVYSTSMGSMSHIYSYAVCAVFCERIVQCEVINKDWSVRDDMALGILFGWIGVLRNVNIIFILFYLLWGIEDKNIYLIRLKKMFHIKRIVRNIMGAMICIIPQLVYWRIKTGHFIVYSYGNEEFSFWNSPKIGEVLFSDAKGLLIFCPVLIFSFAGLFYLMNSRVKCGVSVVAVLVIDIYINASWWCWWLGAAYGMRCFCEFLCLFAIPMGAFWNRFIGNASRIDRKLVKFEKYFFIIVAVVCCLISVIFIKNATIDGTINKNLASWLQLRNSFTNLF